jgi:hypothetical protein
MRRCAALLALLAAASATGCSTEDEGGLPVACQATAESVRRALERAPESVTLDGTSISDCFTRASEPGDIQSIGFAFTEAAAELARDARENPGGDSALELGYLLGAVRAGASDTSGIHDELVRRVEQELAEVDTNSQAFSEGERAGLESG